MGSGYFYGPLTFVSLVYFITSSRSRIELGEREGITRETKRLFVGPVQMATAL